MRNRILNYILPLIALVLLVSLAACQTGQRGSVTQNPPGSTVEEEPVEGQGEGPAAEETDYTYLVDMNMWMKGLAEHAQEMDLEEDLPEDMEIPDDGDFLSEMGIEQLNLTSDVDFPEIHAHGEYQIVNEELKIIDSEYAQATSVDLPSHFPADRWVGHVFLANPDKILGYVVSEIEAEFFPDEPEETDTSVVEEESGMSSGYETGREDLEMALMMFGFESLHDLYSWMSDEIYWCYISNPEMTVGDPPFLTFLAIAADNPMEGLDVFHKLAANPMTAMVGITAELGSINDYSSVIIPFPDPSTFLEMEGIPQDEIVEELMTQPPIAITAIDDYIFIGSQPVIESATSLYSDGGSGDTSDSTLELLWNWDSTFETFNPNDENLAPTFEMMPTLHEVLVDVYDSTRELDELGVSTASIDVTGEDSFELDVYTSVESVNLYKILTEILFSLDEDQIEAIGDELGNYIESQFGFNPTEGYYEAEIDPDIQPPPVEPESDEDKQ